MAEERYKRVGVYIPSYSLPDSPVEIIEGVILLDTFSDSVLLQIKLCNNADTNIDSASISIECFDDMGVRLTEGGPILYSYLDQNVSPRGTFGDRSAIALPDVRTRIVDIALIEARLANGEIADIISMHKIAKPKAEVMVTMGEALFCEYFRINNEENEFAVIYIPQEIDHDYWLCTCGHVNRIAVDNCKRCGRNKEKQFTEINAHYLAQTADKFGEEPSLREQERQGPEIEEGKPNEPHKIGRLGISAIVIPLLIFCMIGYLYISEPLTEVIANSNTNKLGLLLKFGKDPNQMNSKQETPLYMAIEKNDLEAVQLLVQNGADVNIKNSTGLSPLEGARQINNQEMQVLLVKSGAEGYIEEKLTLIVGADLDSTSLFSNSRKYSETVETTARTYYADGIPKDEVEYYFTGDRFGGTEIGWQKAKCLYVGALQDSMPDGDGILYVYRSEWGGQNLAEYVKRYEGGFRNGKYDGRGLLYWENIYGVNSIIDVKNPPVLLNGEFKEGNVYGQYARYYDDGSFNDDGTCYDGIITSSEYGYIDNSALWAEVKLP